MLENHDTPGWFWVAGQLTLLIVWGVVLVVGDRYYLDMPEKLIVEVGGMIISVTGLITLLLAAYELRDNLTPFPEPDESATLVTSGVYAKVRHPMYGGVILIVLGFTIALTAIDGAYVVLALVAFFYGKSLYEEIVLRERFRGYANYVRRTKRFFPYLW